MCDIRVEPTWFLFLFFELKDWFVQVQQRTVLFAAGVRNIQRICNAHLVIPSIETQHNNFRAIYRYVSVMV